MNDNRIDMPTQMDTDTLMSVVVMAQEAEALERDALGLLRVTDLDAPNAAWVGYSAAMKFGMKHGLQFVPKASVFDTKARTPLAWHAKVAGFVAAAAVALGVGQAMWTSDRFESATPSNKASSGSNFARVNSFVHADLAQEAQERLGWLRPTSVSVPREFAAGYGNRMGIRLTPMETRLGEGGDGNGFDGFNYGFTSGGREEERSMVLAVFRDSNAPGCDCVRVQSGFICGGQKLNDLDHSDLVTAAMEGQCMDGAQTVSVFALSGPIGLLPKTREEAEALAIMLADLPWECLMNDSCVQHMVAACLPGGVSMVSKTLALN